MSKSEKPREHRIRGHGIDLSVLEIGRTEDPPVIMVHGLRDTAWALLPVAQHLLTDNGKKPGYRVLLTELRGHGASDRSAAYAMPDFLLDLYQAITTLTSEPCALFGHSLGGHIVTKFAALFPELVKALLVVEGLGPPQRPYQDDEASQLVAYREMLLSQAATRAPRSKPIKNIADVTERLCRNNPRLDPAQAELIAPHLVTRSTSDDTLVWAFDSRANSVFLGTSHTDNARFWRQVKAPTCLISGMLSYQYWGRELSTENFSGRFAEGEIEARVESFPHSQHHWFEQSGHLVHYDEPDHLGALTRQFLEQKYV